MVQPVQEALYTIDKRSSQWLCPGAVLYQNTDLAPRARVFNVLHVPNTRDGVRLED